MLHSAKMLRISKNWDCPLPRHNCFAEHKRPYSPRLAHEGEEALVAEATSNRSGRWVIAAFGVTTLLGAFLLFEVQPLVSKAILPWFGGVPAVWTACMLFFQVLLLGGYVYAHLLALAGGPEPGAGRPGGGARRRGAAAHSAGGAVAAAARRRPHLADRAVAGRHGWSALLRALRPPALWCRRGSAVRCPAARPIGSTPCRTSARWWPC